MSDQPGIAEAFPDKLQIFRRDRKMTFGDQVNHDPNDWQTYIRADAVQAQIDAAVKAGPTLPRCECGMTGPCAWAECKSPNLAQKGGA